MDDFVVLKNLLKRLIVVCALPDEVKKEIWKDAEEDTEALAAFLDKIIK